MFCPVWLSWHTGGTQNAGSEPPPFVITATDAVLVGPYDPSSSGLHPDGDRIAVAELITSASDDDGAPTGERFVVVVNWCEELRQRMGGS